MKHLLGVDIQNTLFVGDQFEKDLAYPLSEGGWGVLITGSVKPREDSPKLYHATDIVSLMPALDIFVISVQ
jgi:FMN phosphatase YigB (HAD superfamily)